MWVWMRVGTDAGAIGLMGAAVDEALMVVLDEHGPLRLRQVAHPLVARAAAVESDLMAALAISVGPRIHRIRQHMIDANIARVDPADTAAVAGVPRERQAPAPQPQPDASDPARLASPFQHRTVGGADRLTRMRNGVGPP